MDFVGDLADGPAPELVARLREALALPQGYVEAPEGSNAVAAALVAARLGYEPNNRTSPISLRLTRSSSMTSCDPPPP